MTPIMIKSCGLCNGSTGVIHDIVYNAFDFLMEFIKYVWVEFGDKYQETMYLTNKKSRCGWVIIRTTMTNWFTQALTTQGLLLFLVSVVSGAFPLWCGGVTIPINILYTLRL